MPRERKYLKNPCVTCGQEQIGVHYHEGLPEKEWAGTCSHGYRFINTFTGCETKCPKCMNRGKIAGYYKSKRFDVKKLRRMV